MKKAVPFIFFVLLSCVQAYSQNDKAWVQMAVKDAEKMLNDSPWGRTQTDTDTSEMFFTPTRPGTSSTAQIAPVSTRQSPAADQQSINNNRADRGALNQAVSVNYHVSLFSAKPVREAISRIVLLNQIEPRPELIDLMQTLVDRDFSKYIVVTVTFNSNDGRMSGPSLQAFSSATAETLKNNTYLERNDGKRIYITDYRAPESDGLGAKFVFSRIVDGKPFLKEGDGSLRFYSELGSKLKLNVKFKVSELMYNGRLEY